MTKDATIRLESLFFNLSAACSVKRYALGTKFYNSLSVPEIVERDDGQFVSYEDYQKALELVQRRQVVIKILEGEVNELLFQMEAIGAGGVSGQRITSTDSDTAQALFDALAAIVQEVDPGSRPHSSDSYLPAHLVDKATAAIAKATGG